jgi:hypothetical protein
MSLNMQETKILLLQRHDYDDHELFGLVRVPAYFSINDAIRDFLTYYEIPQTNEEYWKILYGTKPNYAYHQMLELPTANVGNNSPKAKRLESSCRENDCYSTAFIR